MNAATQAVADNYDRRMGIVTLFCNVAAAIGFAVFALTKSEILQEFGVVAGINIMVLFFISLILIPRSLVFCRHPNQDIQNTCITQGLIAGLTGLERWCLNHRKLIYVVTAVILLFLIAGTLRLKSVDILLMIFQRPIRYIRI
jgi:predicted RND superfamily exporter protein